MLESFLISSNLVFKGKSWCITLYVLLNFIWINIGTSFVYPFVVHLITNLDHLMLPSYVPSPRQTRVNAQRGHLIPSKMRFSERNCIFCFCLFYVGERQTRKKKKQKTKIAKRPQKSVCVFFFFFFSGWVGKKVHLSIVFREIAKHYLCLEGKEGHFRQHYLFWENCPFYVLVKKSWNTTKRGFSKHMGKPKITFCGEQGVLKGVSKRPFYYLWSTKAVLCWKHYFCGVFSKHSFCREKGLSCKKKNNYQNSEHARCLVWGGWLSDVCVFCVFCGFNVCVVLVLFFLFVGFVFSGGGGLGLGGFGVRWGPKGPTSPNPSFFCFFSFSPKSPFFEILLLLLSFFFFFFFFFYRFFFCLPFQNSIFAFSFVLINPLWENIIVFFVRLLCLSLCFPFLSSFLLSFTQTSLTSPFSNRLFAHKRFWT